MCCPSWKQSINVMVKCLAMQLRKNDLILQISWRGILEELSGRHIAGTCKLGTMLIFDLLGMLIIRIRVECIRLSKN